MATTLARIEFRRKTAAQWTSSNEVLLASEPGVETDTGKFKLGDGTTGWSSLPYQAGTAASLAATYATPAAVSTAIDAQAATDAARFVTGIIHVKHPTYGATDDAKRVTDAAVTGNQFTTTQGALTTAHIGMTVNVPTAGSATVPFTATITAVTSGTATLSASATTNVTGAVAWFGTINTTAIQAAINAASSAASILGGVVGVSLASGGLYLTGSLTPKSNVTILGGGATLIKHAADSAAFISNRATFAPLSRFSVYGLKFQGEGQTAGNISISTTERRSGIGVYNVDRITVVDCEFADLAYAGVSLTNATNVRIERNLAVNVSYTALENAFHVTTRPDPGGGTTVQTNDVVIAHNSVYGCMTAAICVQSSMTSGVLGSDTPYRARVHDNYVETSAFAAIAIEVGVAAGTSAAVVRQVTVHDNICKQTATAGSGCWGIQVSDNSSAHLNSDNTEFKYILIHDNIVESTDGGILFEGSYSRVTGNIVHASAVGISLAGNGTTAPLASSVSSNTVHLTPVTSVVSHGISAVGITAPQITDNHIYYANGNTAGGDGVHTFSCIRAKINDNTVESAAGWGIWCGNAFTATIKDNYVYNSNQSAINGVGGIHYDNATTLPPIRTRISDNEIYDEANTMYYAIQIGGTNSRIEISYNKVRSTNWLGNGWLSGTGSYMFANFTELTGNQMYAAAIAVTTGTFTYTNADPYPEQVVLTGGTISSIIFQRASSSHQTALDVATKTIRLEIGDALIIASSVAPTVNRIPIP